MNLDLRKLMKPVRKGVTHGRLSVGPELAEELLKIYNLKNYRKMPPRSKVYCEMILAGSWYSNYHDPLLFVAVDEGFFWLLNGQSRLKGVVLSGETIEFQIVILESYVPVNIKAIDTGTKRTLAQIFAGEGYNHPSNAAAVSKILTKCLESGTLAQSEYHCEATYLKHHKAIDYICGITAGKGILAGVNAPYRAALVRAYYTLALDRLMEFNDQYIEGTCHNKQTDSAALELKQYHTKHILEFTGGGGGPTATYSKICEKALHAFHRGEHYRSGDRVEAEGDLLPLPGEHKKKKK